MVTRLSLCCIALSLLLRLTPARCQTTWSDFADLAKEVSPLDPTPMGEGHVGRLESGACAQVRFPVPKEKPLGYRVYLGNVVAYTGYGTSYQLILRRDNDKGTVIYAGPVIAKGDDWNTENRNPIDLLKQLTDKDYQQGYLDICITAKITDDGWTLYRHNPQGRGISAQIVEATEEVRRSLKETDEMRKRGVSVIPMPQAIDFMDGSLALSTNSRIVLVGKPTDADRFTAKDLADQINESTHLQLNVSVTPEGKAGDIILRRIAVNELKSVLSKVKSPLPSDCSYDQAYHLIVTDRVVVTASGETGLFYGAQTVAQLVRKDSRIQRCTVSDWPAYPLRGLQWDVARGQTVKVDFWKFALREFARCKLNAIMIYGEDDYNFKRYPFLGREDTFTPGKAKVLSEFAEKYHVQLIPQFEALGHAGAVLSHEELKGIREGGNAWVFCTSNPKTWEFLDGVFGELAEQFPNSKYFHIGADEFEDGFGKCPQCQARVNEIGIGGLYAAHLNKLNQICKKHGRTMLFWPSHAASSPDISYLTLKNKDKMERDCIPTEWIYHGPPTYPEIKQYQEAGFKDVWTSPAVVCYSIIYPDYRTTYRGIRGFLRAGREQGVKGTCTTTWEWMHGALFENSWLGMIYACECGWSLGRTSSGDYNRRFAQHWLGITSPDIADRIADTIAEPWSSAGAGAICRCGVVIRDLFWSDPRRVRRQFVMKDGLKPEHSKGITEAAQTALDRLAGIRTVAQRNQRMLDATQLAFLMYRHAGKKLALMDAATEQYNQASRASAGEASTTLSSISDKVKQLAAECDGFIEVYDRAVQECGAYKGDLDRLVKLKESYIALTTELADLGEQVKTGKVDRLPPGAKFGFDSGRYVKIGAWQPSQMNEESCEIRLDITPQLKKAGPVTIEWEYTSGAHGVTLLSTTLFADGKPVANDEHGGWTGSGSHDNAYILDLKEYDPKVKYEIVGRMKSSGGTDSNGNVWLILSDG